MHGICEKHRESWYIRIRDAADEQPGFHLLQQCAFRDRRRCVHIGYDDRVERAPDGRDTNLCDRGRIITDHQLQLRRETPEACCECNRYDGDDGFGLHPFHVACDHQGTGISDQHFQFKQGTFGGRGSGAQALFCGVCVYAFAVHRTDRIQVFE